MKRNGCEETTVITTPTAKKATFSKAIVTVLQKNLRARPLTKKHGANMLPQKLQQRDPFLESGKFLALKPRIIPSLAIYDSTQLLVRRTRSESERITVS